MIKNREDYKKFILADNISSGRVNISKAKKIFLFFFPDKIWEFQILLRKCEYYKNNSDRLLFKLLYSFYKYKFRKKSLALGFSIPENVFGPGLCIPHYGTIVVNANSKVGANCKIHVCTNIGASGGTNKAPKIGDNVYIAPGVKIYGDITIASNNAIAANSVVNKNFTDEGNLIGGVPAKIIDKVDIKKILKHL
jgi:serine O-acetyltransferase